MDILAKDDPTAMPSAFKAEIIKTRKDHRDIMKVRLYINFKLKKKNPSFFFLLILV